MGETTLGEAVFRKADPLWGLRERIPRAGPGKQEQPPLSSLRDPLLSAATPPRLSGSKIDDGEIENAEVLDSCDARDGLCPFPVFLLKYRSCQILKCNLRFMSLLPRA